MLQQYCQVRIAARPIWLLAYPHIDGECQAIPFRYANHATASSCSHWLTAGYGLSPFIEDISSWCLAICVFGSALTQRKFGHEQTWRAWSVVVSYPAVITPPQNIHPSQACACGFSTCQQLKNTSAQKVPEVDSTVL